MAQPANDSTRRFSDRVDNYIRYRPGYPAGVLDVLRGAIGLAPEMVVADIGSGTGLSTALFLQNGNQVYAVEPNREMRLAAERLLGAWPAYHSVNGTAEATTLPDASIDCVVAAQAFHWFDPVKTRTEFRRILRPGGHVVLLWNRRLTDATPFLRAYEKLLENHGTDYAQVRHERIDEAGLRDFFLPGFRRRTLPNAQSFDFAALQGRLLSSSYAPNEGHAEFGPMMELLRRIFDEHQRDGSVRFEYETEIYCGTV